MVSKPQTAPEIWPMRSLYFQLIFYPSNSPHRYLKNSLNTYIIGRKKVKERISEVKRGKKTRGRLFLLLKSWSFVYWRGAILAWCSDKVVPHVDVRRSVECRSSSCWNCLVVNQVKHCWFVWACSPSSCISSCAVSLCNHELSKLAWEITTSKISTIWSFYSKKL